VPGRIDRNAKNPQRDVESQESFKVNFWKIRSYKGRRGQSYSVRWTVAGDEYHQTFRTRALADSRLAELRTYAREGVAFDVATGLPIPEVRKAQAEAAAGEGQLSWYQHTLNYLDRRREGLSGNRFARSRRPSPR
jgi:hypothetical protein